MSDPLLNEIFGNVIHTYSREDALDDGELVDLSSFHDGQFKIPIACTREVWNRYVEFQPEDGSCQDIKGRAWDVLWMLFVAIKRGELNEENQEYKLYVAKADRGDWLPNEDVPERNTDMTRATHRLVTLKAICGPGDHGEPVITIMLPYED